MIEAKELRTGNLLSYMTSEGDILTHKVDWQDLKWLDEDPKGYNLAHSPIPLTEEWLLKMGFVSDPYRDRYDLQGFYIDCDKKSGVLELWATRTGVTLKTVHQLQNLYHALTGKELVII